MKNIKAFKIDLRFLYDLKGNEYDVGAREAIDEAKILHDKFKFLREGKNGLYGVLNTAIPEGNANKKEYIILYHTQVEAANWKELKAHWDNVVNTFQKQNQNVKVLHLYIKCICIHLYD